MLNSLFDRLWGMDGINPFGHPSLLQRAFEGGDDLEEEVFEVVKGDYKTTVICRFNKAGYLVSHKTISHPVVGENMAQLKDKLTQALSKEDYEQAALIQKKINIQRKVDESKPTL